MKILILIGLIAASVIADDCVSHTYRTLDGSCNNLKHPKWGAAGTPYARLLPPRYGDGIYSPPKSTTGADLPSARLVSTTLFGQADDPDTYRTIVAMQFGQFVAHDMSFGGAPIHPGCCENGKITRNDPLCYPILVPKDDPVRSADGIECMNFQRTLTDRDNEMDENKSNQPAQQITVVTGFLDLSLIYGNFEKEMTPIREFSGGRLKMDVRNGKEWPPHNPEGDSICYVDSPGETCYFGGDPRLNQSPDLSILHIYFIREHNRLAGILHEINPNWSDERVFQEARRINIAQYQHFTYYEWLPVLLGEQKMIDAKLIYNKTGGEYVDDYDENVDPSALNDHAASAFRYFHSSIEGTLNLISESRECTRSMKISDVFLRPKILEQDDNYDSFGRGMATQPFEKPDKNFDVEVKEFLLKHLSKYGDDIRSIDIQRGRDHGIASYNDFRELCGIPRAKSWEDYSDVMSTEDIEKLKSIYPSFDDVDLSVGGILERRSVPPSRTYNCIYLKQFYNTRVGDRYWYERSDPEFAFTPSQLSEIRKSSMSRIFCDNGNNISSMQPNAFVVPSNDNKVVPCTEIPSLDYTKWRDVK